MTERFELLDIWMALGGCPLVFEQWMSDPRRTVPDAWAQLMGAISGKLCLEDTNPPPGELADLVLARTTKTRHLP